MFHPATLLLAWAGFVLVLPLFSLTVLALLLIPLFAAALSLARARTLALLRRTRWLLLSLALLFAFATPGLMAPGPLGQLGLTEDGLLLAAEHLARLLLLLATLALLHETIGTEGLVSGLHWLLAPLDRWRGLRERIVVRLLLVVDFVESANFKGGWRDWLGDTDVGPQRLGLVLRPSHWQDGLALLLVAGGVVMVWAW